MRGLLIAIVCLAMGCSLDRTGLDGDAGRIDAGGSALDAGSFDAAGRDGQVPDAGADAGPPPSDGGFDARAPDGGFDGGVLDPGGALGFDGFNDFVRADVPSSASFTLEAWIKTTASRVGTAHYHGLGVLFADENGENDDFGTSVLNERFAFGIGNPDMTIVSTSTVNTDAWVHVAATRDATTGEIAVHVNGVREASAVSSNTRPLTAHSNFDIGGNVPDSRMFSGRMDEVRVWNVARSAEAIRSTMHLRLRGDEPGLVSYWRFDDGSGTTAGDSGPAGNHGDLGDGSSFRRPGWVASDAPIYR